MTINDLVKKYKNDRESFLNRNYNETQLRNDFIDPFLKCLGWDVDNYNEKTFFLRDVIQEESIEVKDENTKKNPDYTLRINGTRKLFVETKKPSINILNSASSAFQTRRYGWSANLGISILTNFENLIIYDCRFKPNPDDNEHVARYKVYSYEEYISSFNEIRNLISYDSANSGELDKAFSKQAREGCTFDEYFLDQIENWREKLASTAIENNNGLDEKDINYIIQRLLNRVIFLRICEDRAIEKYETIKGIQNYNELKDLFRKVDKKFNSGLFDFIDDTLSLEVDIDAKILIDIFAELYFPKSPYDFSVVDPVILSQIYERFLGYKIVVGENSTFDVVEAPEVAASSGVVPTPRIIVEQIVNDTLTPLVEGKTFSELCDLKIADVCCGSGTFLITCFDFLKERIIEQITEEGIDDSSLVYNVSGSETSLTLKGKRNIIENNLYGVDINPYAVEVTEFSLLLKLLEGENDVSVNNFIQQHSGKVLPNLSGNIKCGNSLVDNNFFNFMPDAVNNDQLLFDIRPFNWAEEYPKVMERGGFDAIVGNPPYVRIQNMQKYIPVEISYYQWYYSVAKKATIDKYFVFIQRAIDLLNSDGILGYIVPHKFFINQGGKELRKLITEKLQISKIIHFGVTQVFPNRSTYTAILILRTKETEEFTVKKVNEISAECLLSDANLFKYKSKKYNKNPWVFLSSGTEEVFNRFNGDEFEKLGDLTEITVGLQTSADKIFIFTPDEETDNTFVFHKKGKKYEVERAICQSSIYDLSFNCFETVHENSYMIFPYYIEEGKALLFSEDNFRNNYPLAWEYLSEFKEQLNKRSLQGTNPKWYQYGRSQSLAKFKNTDKLIWTVLSTKPTYVLDTINLYFTGGGNGPYYGLINQSGYSLEYFLGILSHPIIESMVKAGASEFRGAYYSHGKQFIENLPIKKIDFSNNLEVQSYNIIIKSVRDLINNDVQIKSEKNSERRLVLKRKQGTLLNRLNATINSLYQISDQDFATVINDEMLTASLGEQ